MSAPACGAATRSGAPCRRAAGPTGRCGQHPPETTVDLAVAVRPQIDAALAGVADDWRTALARTLADALDTSPNAAMSAELRRVMTVIDGASDRKGGDPVDALAARRAERLAAAGGTQ